MSNHLAIYIFSGRTRQQEILETNPCVLAEEALTGEKIKGKKKKKEHNLEHCAVLNQRFPALPVNTTLGKRKMRGLLFVSDPLRMVAFLLSNLAEVHTQWYDTEWVRGTVSVDGALPNVACHFL